MAGLADLVGGFQQGAYFRERLNQFGEDRRERQRKEMGQRRALEVETGGELSPEIGQLYDPYEWSLGKMFRGIFSSEARQQRRNRRALEGRDLGEMISETVPSLADGGTVREEAEALRRQNIARFEAEDAARRRGSLATRAARGARRLVNKAGPRTSALGLGAAVLPQLEEDYDTRVAERFGLEEYPEGSGDPSLGGFARYAGRRALGYASDLGNLLTFGQAGRLYRDTPEEEAPELTDEQAAVVAQAPAEEPTSAAPPSAGDGAATPRQEPSPFVGEAEPEQAAAQLGNIDIMPDQMPSMSTRDWVQYRSEMVPALMMQGVSAKDAHEQVTALQHQGFLRYAQQAAAMLQAGNQQGAARALKAAYQYFPNGSDVRFGFQNGTLVGLGINEETGEPQGKPQAITPEYLAAMVMNFEDPSKFTAWTKDWRDEAFRERTYEEVTRPAAQGTLTYQEGMLDVARQNALANQVDAAARLASAEGRGGMSEADIARSEEAFRQRVEALGLTGSEAEADELASIMAQIRIRVPPSQMPDNRIINDIMRAYAEGNLEEVKAALGLQ